MMTDELLGDIVVEAGCVRFSDRVGHIVTTEQGEVLRRTAEVLGKPAFNDRYPADSLDARNLEVIYGACQSWQYVGRNEHGVPKMEELERFGRELDRVFGGK